MIQFWQLTFHQREGLTIHDVTFAGRSLFYRLSLSEMFVPYGDSRAPYPRKAAFDLGNNGAGVNANNLKLGRSAHIDTMSLADPIRM